MYRKGIEPGPAVFTKRDDWGRQGWHLGVRCILYLGPAPLYLLRRLSIKSLYASVLLDNSLHLRMPRFRSPKLYCIFRGLNLVQDRQLTMRILRQAPGEHFRTVFHTQLHSAF
jgi:hypothetical protein